MWIITSNFLIQIAFWIQDQANQIYYNFVLTKMPSDTIIIVVILDSINYHLMCDSSDYIKAKKIGNVSPPAA